MCIFRVMTTDNIVFNNLTLLLQVTQHVAASLHRQLIPEYENTLSKICYYMISKGSCMYLINMLRMNLVFC